MGLDMYLEKCNRKAWGYKDFNIEKVKENQPGLYKEIKPFLANRGEYVHWESIFTEVGYWRKANHIHKWFVENVQDGIDDCDYHHEVTKEILEELLEICERVVDSSELVSGKIKNGEKFENGKWVACMEDGKYIKDPSVAMELLPTESGFFFGGTDYDEYYLDDVRKTIDIITRVLETTDFETEMVHYVSSW